MVNRHRSDRPYRLRHTSMYDKDDSMYVSGALGLSSYPKISNKQKQVSRMISRLPTRVSAHESWLANAPWWRASEVRYLMLSSKRHVGFSLAGPFVGGYLASSIGFNWLLAILGLLNLLFTPFLVLLRELPTPHFTDQVTTCWVPTKGTELSAFCSCSSLGELLENLTETILPMSVPPDRTISCNYRKSAQRPGGDGFFTGSYSDTMHCLQIFVSWESPDSGRDSGHIYAISATVSRRRDRQWASFLRITSVIILVFIGFTMSLFTCHSRTV